MTENVSPFLRELREFYRLSGFSGAEVFRGTRDGRNWFIRKVAASKELSPRLRLQAEKQRTFCLAMGDIIRAPKVLQTNEIEGRFYFDMEFVRGLDGVSYLRQASYHDVTRFADKIASYLKAASNTKSLLPSSSPALFVSLYSKLCEIQRKTQAMSPHTLVRLFMALDIVHSMPLREPTLCHGDFSLKNLIIDDSGDIWGIDLLDAPFEHYWHDIAKLHQDLTGSWFLLDHGRISPCVLSYLSERTLSVASELDPAYATAHPLLLAITFARILPYAHTAKQLQFISDRIEYFAGMIQT